MESNQSGEAIGKRPGRDIIKIIIFCVLAALLNILLNNFVMNFLRLPLFLDTVFTAAVAFSAGIIPGMAVAVLNWLGACIYYKEIQYYVFCSIAEVLIICAFKPPAPDVPNFASKERVAASYAALISKLFLLYILCAVTVSVLGGIIDYLSQLLNKTHSLHSSVEDTFKPGLIMSNMPLLAVNIISRLPINIVDRFIVIFAGFFISRGLIKLLNNRRNSV
jgi:hypothetical protein